MVSLEQDAAKNGQVEPINSVGDGGTANPYTNEYFDAFCEGSLRSARVILGELSKFHTIESVADIGCGSGCWSKASTELGAKEILAIDGEYVDRTRLLIPSSAFRVCDLEHDSLTIVIPLGTKFKLVICVEVAEHLSFARSESFIAEICQLGDLILFSAAVPGQGGVHHVNEQWPEFWASLFEKNGFACFDFMRCNLWTRQDIQVWYAQNIMLFARQGSTSFDSLSLLARPTTQPWAVVHPRYFEYLNSELAKAHSRIGNITHAQRELESKMLATQGQLLAVYASSSWRITSPIRGAISFIRHLNRELRRIL